MDLSRMLSTDALEGQEATDTRRMSHQYPTRHAASTQEYNISPRPLTGAALQRPPRTNGVPAAGGAGAYGRASPAKKNQKHVVFQLIDPEDPRIQARLPMRVMISTSDTTEGIITTVKNFYGLYEYGVSFENKDGISMIATYDNFEHDMTVYVRTVAAQKSVPAGGEGGVRDSASPKRPTLGAPFEMRPPLHSGAFSPTRSAARSAGVRSMSPQSDIGRRSASVAPGGKPRPQRTKSKDNSVYGDGEGYSSGDNGGGSVASSRRSKIEVVNPEISTDNILEGGRRKRAFESSELPLFVPPQVPMSTSISSISPQRRAGPPNAISPYPYSNQQTFSYIQPLPSPQSYGSGPHYPLSGVNVNGYSNGYNTQSRHLRGRPASVPYPSGRPSGVGVLPTPDPTVGSAISDEDVALQLMRLGDPMAFSHGRTSTSTLDDAMSGKADAASSDEESEGEEDEDESALPNVPHFSRDDAGPQRKKQRLMNELPSEGTSGEDYDDDHHDATFMGSDGLHAEHDGARKLPKSKMQKARPNMSGPGFAKTGSARPRANSMVKPKNKPLGQHQHQHSHPKTPVSPSSMPAPSRKGSLASLINFQHPLGTDEDDLSSKPRCQRCRKSKKGCDRQRPCGRCRDAGIGVEGCVSEDEGNGRKGRYGRHMGVSIKKAEESFVGGPLDAVAGAAPSAPAPGMAMATTTATLAASMPANGYFLAPALPDKSKKRKR